MKMSPGTALDISLRWDAEDCQPVGRLAYRNRIAYLEYDASFLQTGCELSPLYHKAGRELQPPHSADVFEGLHGVFNDSLPDAWGRLLLDQRARQLGIEPATLTPLDRLACVGSSGIGALCYAPANDVWASKSDAFDLDALAAAARSVLMGDIGDIISMLGLAGGSPGGARPKALVALNDAGHAVYGSDDVAPGYDHYLLKFAGHEDPEDIAAIEMAYSMMAKDAGVAMPETRLLEGNKGQRYFAARRFDRDGNRRVHIHSAAGLLYADPRTPSLDYKDLILLTRNLTRDQRESQAMYALGVFNALAHNRDDHARQFSFMLQRDGTWCMAPAYDLTFSPGPGGEHSSTFLGHGKGITRTHLIELGQAADIKARDAAEIIERTATAIGKWKSYASEYGVGNTSTQMIAATLQQCKP